MAIALDDPRLQPVKNDIKRALAAGYHGRIFTEIGLIDSLRQVFGPEIAWCAADINFEQLIRSMPEFIEFFGGIPLMNDPLKTQKIDLK